MGRQVWVLAIVACGSPSAAPDASPPPDAEAFVGGPNAVIVHTRYPVDYIRYRYGDHVWGTPEQLSPTEYRLHVDDAYQVITVCEYPDGVSVDTELQSRTIADGDGLFYGCAHLADAPITTYARVRGRMLQPGSIDMDDYASSSTAPWSFTLTMPTGTHDLIALDTTYRIAIRRNLKVPGDTTLEDVDVGRDGVALETKPFQVFGVGGHEFLRSFTAIATEHGGAAIPGTATYLRTVPSAALLPGEQQGPSLWISGENTSRGVSCTTLDQMSFYPMPELAKDVFTYTVPDNKSLRAEFTIPLDADAISISISDGRVWAAASVTRTYLAATGHSYIAFDTPRDFYADWRADLLAGYVRSIDAWRYTATTTSSTHRFDYVTDVLGN